MRTGDLDELDGLLCCVHFYRFGKGEFARGSGVEAVVMRFVAAV
jgi:hypothetical protein